MDRSIFRPKIFLQPRRYLRAGEDFNKLENRYPNLEIKKGIIALRFERQFNEETLIGYDRRAKKQVELRADQFVLCCGALNNPEILLNSDLGLKIPALGKYLMDHPMGNLYQFKCAEKSAPI